MPTKEPRYENRLIHEKSPYLLQHSHNPVDWYPWNEDAFLAAKENDKPIFLSIGYATCHWCHVMERESFENPEIAKLMNETFINIKVDREELPEIDNIYMEFAQSMMSGAAGWPLNVIITPDLQPFFAATYLPPNSRHGLMGLTDLIKHIHEIWQGEEREAVIMQASKIVEIFAGSIHAKGEELPDKEQVDEMAEVFFKLADPVYGGIKGAPKFPIGYQSSFMLRYSIIHQDSRALFLVERTLDMMHRGGIYDHLGGGFSRYSVDEAWLIPHFEKMLYDNALLGQAYLESWQLTKRPLDRQVCDEILHYVLRDMTHSEGGFFSAEDAETEGKEGFFYTWTPFEVKQILGSKEGALFCEYFDVTEAGNFEGRSILHSKISVEEFAVKKNKPASELFELLSEQRQKLWTVREKRVHPFKDDKILSSWNGLMIYTLIEAGCAFNDKNYISMALQSARFIKNHMWQEGHLLRRWRDGEALYSAGLNEYAFLIRGLLSLFEAGCGSEWLAWAMHMSNILEAQFKEKDGAFYQTDGSDPSVIVRKCQFSDGAEPSGNSIHCENLLRLFQLTLEPFYLKQAEDILKAVKQPLDSYSPGYCYHGINLLRYYDKHAKTIVIALNQNEENYEAIHQAIYKDFIPHKAVIWRRQNDEKLFNMLPYLREHPPLEGKTTLYICHEGVCRKPISEVAEMLKAIRKL